MFSIPKGKGEEIKDVFPSQREGGGLDEMFFPRGKGKD